MGRESPSSISLPTPLETQMKFPFYFHFLSLAAIYWARRRSCPPIPVPSAIASTIEINERSFQLFLLIEQRSPFRPMDLLFVLNFLKTYFTFFQQLEMQFVSFAIICGFQQNYSKCPRIPPPRTYIYKT